MNDIITIHWATDLPVGYRDSLTDASAELVNGRAATLLLFGFDGPAASAYAQARTVRLFRREVRDHDDGSQWRSPWEEAT